MKGKKYIAAYICAAALAWILASSAYAQAPTLPLKRSLELAEETIAKTSVDLKKYYLFSVTLTNSSHGQFWYLTYRAIVPSEYNELFAKVYMDGSVDLSGGPFSSNSGY
ncbi:MAG: hypothetical protein PHH75_00620 [Candidatus Omnitrophica bacterium]|nr:hypothetical protein [Candidatus Omnitrophota bacterium]MDD5573669.1 hypothetical protein [Candidatus Omnitrophota bacterium]